MIDVFFYVKTSVRIDLAEGDGLRKGSNFSILGIRHFIHIIYMERKL